MLHIYNTLTRQKEQFAPLDPSEVRMYVCGPTVYGSAHIGHAMSYIVFDVVRRYLEFSDYRVRHVQNFTDVDDKIIRRAHDTGEEWDQLSCRYAEEFLSDMDSLNVLRAHSYPRASEMIEQIVADVARLIELGHAYEQDGDVYFRVMSDPMYGQLSHRRLDEMNAGARVEVDERKEHPMDFALWKSSKPGEPAWDSPWGPGRPGWHIECTSMSRCALGDQIDIHGGGNDLIFPHHENEIAQSEQLTGKRPFAKYWMHNGFVQFGEGGNDTEAKMARSVGNVIPISEVVRRYGADGYRLFVLSSHYRRPLSVSDEAMSAAATAAERLAAAAQSTQPGTDIGAYASYRTEFIAAMDDDFNTSRALAVLYELATEVNRLNARGADGAPAASLLRELGTALGLRLEAPSSGQLPAGAQEMIRAREEHRTARQFAEADRLRAQLLAMGVVVEDTAQGTKWHLDG